MPIDRTIILSEARGADIAKNLIDANWKEMAQSGHPMGVRLYEHKAARSLEQQSLMWLRLGEIAEQVWIGGRQYSDEVWHEHAKREWLPDEEGSSKRCRKGYRKWAINPMTGERILIGSTTMLTTFGMSEYMTQLEAWAAAEMGVRFSASPREQQA